MKIQFGSVDRFKFGFLAIVLGVTLFGQACSRVSFQQGEAPSAIAAVDVSLNPDDHTVVTDEGFRYPALSDYASLVYEDLFPNPGDADFSDVVIGFKIREVINERKELESIHLDFIPKARGSDSDHKLLLIMDGKIDQPGRAAKETRPLFAGGARIEVNYFDRAGSVVATKGTNDTGSDLVVFDSTCELFRGADGACLMYANVSDAPRVEAEVTARIDIVLDSPALNPVMGRRHIDIARYRFVLAANFSGQKIDVVDVVEDAIDGNGFPFGLIVPVDWAYPRENVRIAEVYPDFEIYKTWLKARLSNAGAPLPKAGRDWFLRLAANADSRVIRPK